MTRYTVVWNKQTSDKLAEQTGCRVNAVCARMR